MAFVLLINPPYTRYGQGSHIQADEPLGLLALAAWVRDKGHQVRILDALTTETGYYDCGNGFVKCGMNDDRLRAEFQAMEKPDLVGITSMFTMHSRGVHDVAAVSKQVWPDVPVIVGGSHASALPDWILEDRNVDVMVRGEGELTLIDLLERRVAGRSLNDVAGTYVRKDGRIFENPQREFIEDLDTLPVMARDLVDMKRYLAEPYRNQVAMDPPRANIITSRGCPYRCVFCAVNSIWRNSYRARSPKSVVDEIESLVKTYGIREIALLDDNLTLNPKRMIAICDEMVRRRVRLRWCTPNGVAIWTLSDELVEKMVASGCYKITFGIETGCPETQKFIGKTQINLDKAYEVIRKCNRLGLWTHSSFIIGFPFETEEHIEETIRYAVDSDLDFVGFFIATPFPGTPLFDIYRQNGFMPELGGEMKLMFHGHQTSAMCDTKFFKKEELDEKLREANRRFYSTRFRKFLNPVRSLRKMKLGWPEIRYFWKLYKLYRAEYKNIV